MAQIDYPIPLLDRGWGLWADDLGNDTLVSVMLNQSDCTGIAGNIPKWCARPGLDCNMSWSAEVTRACSPDRYGSTTLGQMRQQYTWPTQTEQDEGLTVLWYTSVNLGRSPTPPAFRMWIKNNLNSTDAMSVIHSALWSRSYARFATAAGVSFATYYTDYPGMKPSDVGTKRVVASSRQHATVVYNYRSNFDWMGEMHKMTGGKPLPPDYVGRTGPDNAGEEQLFHCAAFGLPCTGTLHPPHR
jgi:hypothetical protein